MRARNAHIVGLLALLATAGSARADKVHLVGGTVVEGKATRVDDRVVIEMAGGQVALPADNVERIEEGESDVEAFDKRYAKLDKRDVKGRMALADFCRDRGLAAREERMLREVIALAPDHAQARARLGYVREKGSWITFEQHQRDKGLVEHEGQWITREQKLVLERLRAETEKAAHQRDAAKARAEAEKKRAAAQPGASRSPTPASAGPDSTTVVVNAGGYPYPVAGAPHGARRARGPAAVRGGGAAARCGAPPCPGQRPRQPRMIPHVRDPSEYLR